MITIIIMMIIIIIIVIIILICNNNNNADRLRLFCIHIQNNVGPLTAVLCTRIQNNVRNLRRKSPSKRKHCKKYVKMSLDSFINGRLMHKAKILHVYVRL